MTSTLRLKNEGRTLENFAVLLLRDAFTINELTDEGTNLNGKLPNGSEGPKKEALDPIRILDIQEIVMSYVNGGETQQNKVWTAIKQSFNKELSRVKNKKK